MSISRHATGVLALAVAGIAGPARAQDAPTDQLSPFARQKAQALLRDHLPCLGCHKLNGEGGTVGPDLSTVRDRRSATYVAAMIADPQRTAPGSAMPRTLMPASTRELVTRYLGGEPSQVDPPLEALRSSGTPDGAALYSTWCASCHGPTGRGDGPNAANLPVQPSEHASRDAMSARSDDSLYDTIASGGAVMNRSVRMPAFGATLSPAEIRALVGYIRQLCRCEGPVWSRRPR